MRMICPRHMLIHVYVLSIYAVFQSQGNETAEIAFSAGERRTPLQGDEKRLEQVFAVDTERCRVQRYDPLSKASLSTYFSKPKQKKVCKSPHNKRPLFKTRLSENRTCPLLDEDVLRKDYLAGIENLQCAYAPLFLDYSARVPDSTYKFGNQLPFNWSGCTPHFEIEIRCSVRGTHEYRQILLMASVVDSLQSVSTRNIETTFFNVVVLGIDSLSRLAFHRTMPKTFEILQKLYGDGLVELFGYNKVGENSPPNQIPMLAGRPVREDRDLPRYQYFDDWATYIWDEYRQEGFSTMFHEEMTEWGLFSRYGLMGFEKKPTDYYPRATANAVEKLYGSNCYFNSSQSSLYLKYLEDTLILHKHARVPLFSYLFLSLATHDDCAGGWRIDEDIVDHFSALHQSGTLNDTVVLLLSDHGFRIGSFRNTRQGTLEDKLPFGFVLLPENFVRQRPDMLRTLKINSRRLVTPFDIHATLHDLVDHVKPTARNLNGSTKKNLTYENMFGVSLVSQIVPSSRDCRKAGIPDEFCGCFDFNLEEDSSLWPVLGQHVVNTLNEMLTTTYKTALSTGCREFALSRTVLVEQVFEGVVNLHKHRIRIETQPRAIFEAFIEHDQVSDNKQDRARCSLLRQNIVRVDQYDKHSQCATGEPFERFCYCRTRS